MLLPDSSMKVENNLLWQEQVRQKKKLELKKLFYVFTNNCNASFTVTISLIIMKLFIAVTLITKIILLHLYTFVQARVQ
jgi:hypothetical protein